MYSDLHDVHVYSDLQSTPRLQQDVAAAWSPRAPWSDAYSADMLRWSLSRQQHQGGGGAKKRPRPPETQQEEDTSGRRGGRCRQHQAWGLMSHIPLSTYI